MEKKLKKRNFKRIICVLSALAFVTLLLVFSVLKFNDTEEALSSQIEYSKTEHSKQESSESGVNSLNIHEDVSFVFNETDETSILDTESAESDVFSKAESEAEPKHGWVINELGYTYVYGDCGYEQFNYKTTALERYVNSLNGYATVFPENTRLFSITVPVSSTFADIPREIYTNDNFYNQSQSAFVSTVASKLNERIITVPIVEVLEEKYDADEYVFFRSDKNWTSLGAYYAYVEFCKKAGFSYHPLENHTINDSYEFLGSFYNATKYSLMEEHPDTLLCYGTVPEIKTSLTINDSGILYNNYNLCNNSVTVHTAYNVFLGRNAPRYELSSTSNGGSLLIIGDSSAHPIVSFLSSHYSKIDIIDPRLFKENFELLLSTHSYDDCIVMCYSTNSVTGNFIPSLNIFLGGNNE